MPLVIPNEGAPELLLFTLLGADYGTPAREVGLFVNNYSPDPATTMSSFTEASFTGYSRLALANGSWMTPTIISNRASSTYDAPGPLMWTNGGGSSVTIYGYFVRSTLSGYISWAEKFATARTMAPGDELDLTAIFTGGTEI